MTPAASAPIGVFDSGVGGLSVLRALQAELPHEHFIYFADSNHAPYGERDDAFLQERSRTITMRLQRDFHIKALVVACNTATAAAIGPLRQEHAELPIIGVEPALKPATATTRTGHVGVWATRATVQSARFRSLLTRLSEQTRFTVQACDGLATAIEASVAVDAPGAQARTRLRQLCADLLATTGHFGHTGSDMDTLVLGCTHYIFAEAPLRELLPAGVHLLETGAPVARQARHLLQQHGLLASGDAPGTLQLCSGGDPALLRAAAEHWLPATAAPSA